MNDFLRALESGLVAMAHLGGDGNLHKLLSTGMAMGSQ